MMAEDIENLREVWDGKIPVCFTLASDEVFTVEQPEPMFVSNVCCMYCDNLHYASHTVAYVLKRA